MKEKEKRKKKEWTSRDDVIYCDVTIRRENEDVWCERRAKKLYVCSPKNNAVKDKRTRIATNCSENTDLSIRVFAIIRDIDTMLRDHYFNRTETIFTHIEKLYQIIIKYQSIILKFAICPPFFINSM